MPRPEHDDRTISSTKRGHLTSVICGHPTSALTRIICSSSGGAGRRPGWDRAGIERERLTSAGETERRRGDDPLGGLPVRQAGHASSLSRQRTAQVGAQRINFGCPKGSLIGLSNRLRYT
jgi:hypothetical protein